MQALTPEQILARRRWRQWGGLFLLLLAVFAMMRRRPVVAPARMEFSVFHTVGSISIYDEIPENRKQEIFSGILQELQALHQCCNVYDAESEVSRLNRTAARAPWKCSPRLWAVMLASRDAWQKTEGVFDVTVGPLMRLWGFHGKRQEIPSDEERGSALEQVGFSKVLLDETRQTVFFQKGEIQLDFGGILKGYACDRVAEILEKNGIGCYLIDLGGNLLLSPVPPPGRKNFSIGIRDPLHPDKVLQHFEARGCAVATSGNYERYSLLDGKKIGHIMDPRTGVPSSTFGSVTVKTASGVDSDVFSTACFVAPELAKRNGIQIWFCPLENSEETAQGEN